MEHIELDNYQQEPENVPFKRPQRKMRKHWISAEGRAGIISIKEVNKLTEYAYHCMLLKVKELFATINEFVFEKDTRQDSTYNAATMHQFICKSLYFELECNYNDTYWVNVKFDNCPFELEIRKMLHAYPFNVRSRYFEAIVHVGEFFESIRHEFDQDCFYTLKAKADKE